MAVSPRIIRRRIKSVTNTRKITKAMELVSAAKMRKAVAATLAARPYAEAAWRAIGEIARASDPALHPLLRPATGKGRALVILMSSDRSLCGGFNSQIVRKYVEFARGSRGATSSRGPDGAAGSAGAQDTAGADKTRTRPTGHRGEDELDLVVVGRKGQDALRRRGSTIVAAFQDLASPGIADARPIADLAIGDFRKGGYDAVYLAYTDFKSALTQIPRVKQVLPVTEIEGLGTVDEAKEDANKGAANEFLFEPSAEAVLDAMLPRLVEAQVLQALLESSASEHSARMMAMRSATDAASEMLEELTLTYNQARQAGITREIAEISSGKAALEK